MSEVKKQIASTFKWVSIIIASAFAYKSVFTAEQFKFIDKGSLMRANTLTGKVEYLDGHKWLSVESKPEESFEDYLIPLDDDFGFVAFDKDEEELDLIPLDDDYVPIKNYVRK